MRRLFRCALLAMAVAAVAGGAAGVCPAAQAGPSAAGQYCWKCMGCGKMFAIVPGAVPPDSCPSCGFQKVISSSAEGFVTDWARRVRCDGPQQSPGDEQKKAGTGDAARGMRGTSNMNVRQATTKLDSIAEERPRGLCALYVQRALEAGGVSGEGHPVVAAKYGRYLLSKGFIVVPDPEDYQPRKGDVVVIQPKPGTSGPGHIAMFDGGQWVSDYRQAKFWGAGRRPSPETYKFYRP